MESHESRDHSEFRNILDRENMQMNPKDLVQKGYDSFAHKDMDAFAHLYHQECKIHVNGMHRFARTYHGISDWIQNHLMFMPQLFDNFSVEPITMINDGNKVFVRASVKATGMEFEAGHFFVIEDEKIAEFYVYDDSQKIAHTMKAI